MPPIKPVLAVAVTILATASHLTFANPPKGPSRPFQTHHACIEHGDDEIPCLLFCTVCGHHDCSPDCPGKQTPDAPPASSLDCSIAAQAVEEASRIDLDR